MPSSLSERRQTAVFSPTWARVVGIRSLPAPHLVAEMGLTINDLRDEMGGHVHSQRTVRSPAFWKLIHRMRCASILQQLMHTYVLVDAQVKIDPRTMGHPTHQRFRLMGVETVADDMPADGLWVGGDHGLHMRQEIGLRARGSTAGSQDLSSDDIAAQDKRARAMANILEFAPLD